MFRPLPLVTLTTDFGDGSSYVAAMKGALLTVNPSLPILDLSHRIPPQNLVAVAQFLAETLPYFPAGCIHVVVVDPGVGSLRDLLCILWNGQVILAPDNGCWTTLERLAGPDPIEVIRLSNQRYWSTTVSATFHGRDILAPVAGHLSLGVSPADLGTPVASWVRLTMPQPRAEGGSIVGEVLSVDAFGNLITNIPAGSLGDRQHVQLDRAPPIRWVRTYADAEPGTLVALIGSSGNLEVAVVCGSAASMLEAGVGTAITVCRDGGS